MRRKTWCLVAVVGLAVLACLPAMAAENPEPAVIVQEESADSCLDYTPLEESDAEPALIIGTPDAQPVAPKPPKCRPNSCPDQPWCPCTYNGAPRISCDPCCFIGYTGEICLS